jgi:hypothetical protein
MQTVVPGATSIYSRIGRSLQGSGAALTRHAGPGTVRRIAGNGARIAGQHDHLRSNGNTAIKIDYIVVAQALHPLDTCVPIEAGLLVP